MTSPDDRNVSRLVLVQLGRIDVDVDDLGVLGELRQLAGDAIVEPDAERQQEIAVPHGAIAIHAAVHAQHVERQRIVARQRAQPHDRHHDRNAGDAHELPQFLAGVRRNDSATAIDHGTFRQLDGGRHLLNLFRWRLLPPAVITGQVHRHIPPRHATGHLHVLGQIDQHRSLAARRGNVKGLAHDRA